MSYNLESFIFLVVTKSSGNFDWKVEIMLLNIMAKQPDRMWLRYSLECNPSMYYFGT